MEIHSYKIQVGLQCFLEKDKKLTAKEGNRC